MLYRCLLILWLYCSVNVQAWAVEHPVIFKSLVEQSQPDKAGPGQAFYTLEQAIDYYQQLNWQHRWPQLAEGPLLREGDRNPQIATLRQQLFLLGDYPRLTTLTRDSQRFDQTLTLALKRFQQRHGAKVDGILGPDSRSMLNVPPIQRINQLIVNQYRIKAFSETAGQRYLQVNIPEFRLRFINGGEVLLQMKTIVGRKKRKTPVFTTEIQALILNPSWTVPKSIAWKDIIPVWMQKPNYPERLNLQVARGWGEQRELLNSSEIDPESMYLGRNYTYFWEAPGPDNTLGRLKFMSRSRYAIYLHDTSAPGLFNEPHRAFSSGCIRVEKAQLLAERLLEVDSPQQSGLLTEMLATTETGEIHLRQPVAVHMTYWTAWIDQSGVLNFRNDIYKRDSWELTQLTGSAQNEAMVPQAVD
ncbi:L,D-transpeptidase family protein [Amphritea balenae]|uniref:L,D-TPase catalytic domain-containing protein n=1 Tax=Amphritea balenae TaxID=452629 RepID=A0A3P1STC2_9GAMM|nr:L,D-transpeptidase family protein [Amphritea balenae]RRD00442.1 hypothetical protein EHS89_04945 [Amphritea balenae]